MSAHKKNNKRQLEVFSVVKPPKPLENTVLQHTVLEYKCLLYEVQTLEQPQMFFLFIPETEEVCW